jgi:hypothetical protein
MRRLLPYERALIDTLGITEEEYFRFVAYQEQYKDIKDGTVFDIKNGAETATVALVLSIIGTLAQVASALLAPRPQAPEANVTRQARERRFSPRFGFDSAQELAQYGDPVNLVYTDIVANPNGGVRVASSLLWSAVHSCGGKQYMQMLATIGSAGIEEIAPARTAFGQTPLRQFVNAGNWLYFRNGGPLQFSHLLRGDNLDPSRTGRSDVDLAYRPYIVSTSPFDGFSQAFSPASFSSFGITSPIAINVDIFERNSDGDSSKRASNLIRMRDDGRGIYWPNQYGPSRVPFPKNHEITLVIAQAKGGQDIAEKAAEEERIVAASAIDGASIYKLGSAKFKVLSMTGSEDVNTSDLVVRMQCVESGFAPEEDYATKSTIDQEAELTSILPQLIAQRSELEKGFNPTFTVPGLTAAQQAAFNKFRGYYDQIETLLDSMLMYKRVNKSERKELDEFVLTNEFLFTDNAVNLANQIDSEENRLEELREDITEIRKTNATDAVKGPRIQAKRAAIQTVKTSLRANRRRLTKLIEQDMFADQKLFNYINQIDAVIRDINSSFRSIKGFQVVNDTDYAPIIEKRRRLGTLGAAEERKIIREVRNAMRETEFRISSVTQIDQATIDQYNASIQSQIDAINVRIEAIKNTLKSPEGLNDFLATKCLTKIEEASYETVSACKVVNFAIKGKVYMRVQGRLKKYGEVTVDGYRQSDNGIKNRSAFFLVFVRDATQENWTLVPAIFALRRAADNDFFFPLYFNAPDSSKRWAFRFEPIYDTASEMRKHGPLPFAYLSSGQTSAELKTIDIPGGFGQMQFYGTQRVAAAGNLPPKNNSPFAIDEWSLYPPSLVTDTDIETGVTKVVKACSSDANIAFSFDDGPEFEITAVTEQQFEPEYRAKYPSIYNALSLVGFNCFSGQGVRSLRSLSLFVTKGKKVRRMSENDGSFPSVPDGPSNYASDIFLDTVLDSQNGIGKFATIAGINTKLLGDSKKMCKTMGYYMDGMIADITSWREFWAEVAPYSMLEFARIGGQDTLIPALPVDATGRINRIVTISALFNQGNILEDSYKEEFLDYGDSTQDIVATIIYRAPERDGVFPKNTSLTVHLKTDENGNALSENDLRRVNFDLSQFVTSRTQALHYGMMMCMQRRHVRRAVEFKTFPTHAPVQPGSYIYVQTDENRWDNISSGIVEEGGVLNAPISESPINGSFNVLLYDGQSQTVSLNAVSVSNGQSSALAGYKGWLFVLGTALTSRRIFRVTEVELDEEGEVTVRAVEHPCEESGGQSRSLIARQDLSLYTING